MKDNKKETDFKANFFFANEEIEPFDAPQMCVVRRLSNAYHELKRSTPPARETEFSLKIAKLNFYKELIDRYVFDIPIEQFAYILTGKREKVKGVDHPSIKWLGTMQDLSCFIGLLCKKRKGKDTYGIWSITQKVFVIDGITIDNKSISTEFSKIKKDRKPYIYFKKLIEKAVD